jgi:hypothetical protein
MTKPITHSLNCIQRDLGELLNSVRKLGGRIVKKLPFSDLTDVVKKVDSYVRKNAHAFLACSLAVSAALSPWSFSIYLGVGTAVGIVAAVAWRTGLTDFDVRALEKRRDLADLFYLSPLAFKLLSPITSGLVQGFVLGNYMGRVGVKRECDSCRHKHASEQAPKQLPELELATS